MEELKPIVVTDYSIQITNDQEPDFELIFPVDYLNIDNENFNKLYINEKPFERVIGWVKL